MRLIGISGKRGSGKTTLAQFLVRDYGFLRVSLAWPLKEMCKRDYGLTDEDVDGVLKEAPTHYRYDDGRYYTPRDILILEGNLKRRIDPDFFCRKAFQCMKSLAPSSRFVIDDIRFLNELEYFKKEGAKFVRLERAQTLPPLEDPSETALDSYKEWDGLLIRELNRVPADLEKFAAFLDS